MMNMKSEKGISYIISTILVLLISISLIFFIYNNLGNLMNLAAKTSTNETEHALEVIGAKIKIDSASSTLIYIRNSGSVDIPKESINIYVDGMPTNFTLDDDIKKGERGALQIAPLASNASYVIKATAGKASDSVYARIP